jgi:hypothetical protein
MMKNIEDFFIVYIIAAAGVNCESLGKKAYPNTLSEILFYH